MHNPGHRGELGSWLSRTTFVLALASAAVGMGNIWRFSYLTGVHGGGPFVLSYIAFLLLIAAPVMVAEVALGRHGGGNPMFSMALAADRSMRSRSWAWFGGLGCVAGLLVLALYSVVGGWALAYMGFMSDGVFDSASALIAGDHFAQFLADPRRLLYWHSVFMLAVAAVSALGIRRGLGIAAWLTVPAMMTLLALLVHFASRNGDMPAAREFLFSINWADFSPRCLLPALGHAFLTLGVGVGVGISFGAYSRKRVPVGRSVLAVAVFDTVFGLFVGLAIFPLVFANNMEPADGPALLFVSLPYAFGNVFGGDLFGSLFFALAALAALGSAVAVLEPAVGLLVQRWRLRRPLAVALACLAVWLLGICVVLSFNVWSQQRWFGDWNFLQLLEWLTADFLLPLVSLGFALFVGWRMRVPVLRAALQREWPLLVQLWLLVLRTLVPLAILVLLFGALVAVDGAH